MSDSSDTQDFTLDIPEKHHDYSLTLPIRKVSDTFIIKIAEGPPRKKRVIDKTTYDMPCAIKVVTKERPYLVKSEVKLENYVKLKFFPIMPREMLN